MKKIAFLIIALIFAVLLAACGSENNGDSMSKTDETTDYRSPSTIVYTSDATPEQISEEINRFLATQALREKECVICGRPLPWDFSGSKCIRCRGGRRRRH